MNLSFDLQLFDTSYSAVITDGVSYSGGEYTLGAVSISTSATGNYAVFRADTSATTGLVGADLRSMTVKDKVKNVGDWDKSKALVGFSKPAGSALTPNQVIINGTSSNTWKIAHSQITAMSLVGQQNNIVISDAAKSGITVEADKDVKSSFEFTNASDKDLTFDKIKLDKGTLTFKNSEQSFNLATGTSMGKDLKVSAHNGDAIKMDDVQGVYKFVGANSSENVSIKTSAALTADVEKMSKVLFEDGSGALTFSNIKSSTVNVKSNTQDVTVESIGSAGAVSIGGAIASKNIKISSITGTGAATINAASGKGNVTLSGTGKEVLGLVIDGSKATYDVQQGWKEYLGSSAGGNVLSLSGGLADLKVASVSGGVASVASSSGTNIATIKSSETNGYNKLGLNIKSDDGTNTVLMVGSESLQAASNVKFAGYEYIMADKNQTLKLGDTSKKVVYLGNGVGETNWNDTNAYVGVTTVQSSKAGGTLIISGLTEESLAASLSAAGGGKNDSLWGGGNGLADTLVAGKGKNTHIFTGKNDGVDCIQL